MIGKDYFARQARTLLRLASLTKDPAQSANLAAKAAELKERSDAAPPVTEIDDTTDTAVRTTDRGPEQKTDG